jgi:hypothetical protein
MDCKIITLTPQMAKELLKMNTKNRSVKPIKNVYAEQMRRGEWKENGEPIIVDINGIIKDGQHRLHAVIDSGHTYKVPLIFEVLPDVMDTIDTGTNRSFIDVLQLEGYKNQILLSATVKSVMTIKARKFIGSGGGVLRSSAKSYISNSSALNFLRENEADILNLSKNVKRFYVLQPVKIYNYQEISAFLFLIGGFRCDNNHFDFMRNLLGIEPKPNTAAQWLYKKMLHAKVNKLGIPKSWKVAAIIKAWNIYAGNDDMPITSMRVNPDKLDKIIKI